MLRRDVRQKTALFCEAVLFLCCKPLTHISFFLLSVLRWLSEVTRNCGNRPRRSKAIRTWCSCRPGASDASTSFSMSWYRRPMRDHH